MATILLPVQNRQGTITSGSVVVPSVSYQYAVLTANLGPAEYGTTKSFRIWLEVSRDSGQSYEFFAGIGWTGPAPQPVDPSLVVDLAPLIGTRVRGVADMPETIRLGLTVDLTDTFPGPD